MNILTKSNPLVKELLMLVPNVAILVGKLAMDKRIPTETKLTLGAAALYLVSPIDGIPDFIPILGHLDDVIMILLIVDGVVNHVDRDIVREHWRGAPGTLDRVGSIAKMLTSFIPEAIRERFFERAFHSKAAKPFHALSRRMTSSSSESSTGSSATS